METDVKTPANEASEASHEGSKPRIVRNREVDKAASDLANDHILPLPPGKSLDWDQAQKYMSLLTPAMWSHFMVYLYRIKPKIRRQLNDPNSPNYIDCLAEPFTLDYLITRHGGGKYQLQAVDNDRRPTTNKEVFKCLFDINDTQYPPILNYQELELEARENKSYIAWLQNKGILDGKGNVMPQPAAAPPASAATNLSAKEVLDILGYAHKMNSDQQAAFRAQFAPGTDSLSKSVGDILLEKMRQDDPSRDWDRMMAFIEKLNKPDSSFAQMLQMQQEQRKTDLEYTRLLLANQQDRTNPRSQFGEFREFLMFAREIWQTGGSGGRRNGWDTGLEIARDVVLPGLQTLGNTITNIMALRNGVAPVAAAPGGRGTTTPQAFDPYANPAARAAYAQSMSQQAQPQPAAAGGPGPPAPNPANPAQPADPQNQLLGLFAQYGNLIVGHLNNGTAGYDFADMITGLLGIATHAMIAAQGEELLVTTMMGIPEMAIFGETRLRQFTHEFIHYQEFLERQEEGEGEEEPPIEPEVVMDTPKIYRPPARQKAGPREVHA